MYKEMKESSNVTKSAVFKISDKLFVNETAYRFVDELVVELKASLSDKRDAFFHKLFLPTNFLSLHYFYQNGLNHQFSICLQLLHYFYLQTATPSLNIILYFTFVIFVSQS